MTFSEFGRRIKSNGSLGTDHGAGAPVIFFGAALNTGSSAITAQNPVSGMIGSSPNIPLNASVSDQIAMQFDLDKFILRLCKIGCMSEAQTAEVLVALYKISPIQNRNFRYCFL
jgi:hypothetical protein